MRAETQPSGSDVGSTVLRMGSTRSGIRLLRVRGSCSEPDPRRSCWEFGPSGISGGPGVDSDAHPEVAGVMLPDAYSTAISRGHHDELELVRVQVAAVELGRALRAFDSVRVPA